jgi:1-deoxy-D-xylulose-5-phosphate reductoisomerase
MEEILLLGATGSIGRQTLDILKFSSDYNLVGISFNSRYEIIEDYLFYFPFLKTVAINDKEVAKLFSKKHPSYKVISGSDCNSLLLKEHKKATVFNALVGNVGLIPSLLAIKQNQDLLLANKESLVIGSSLIKEELKTSKSKLYPVDSEHVALAKLLKELNRKKIASSDIKKLLVTASGGSLRDYKKEDLKTVSKNEVLSHPTWSMGNKITVDCSTLVNKGYEVIEASVLFDYPLEKVGAIICRESLVHAKIIYLDKGVEKEIFEYSPCDMKVAIAYALSKGKLRMHKLNKEDKKNIKKLHFGDIDNSFYPLFNKTIECYKKYGNIGMIYFNALDSLAISYFLDDKIPYLSIVDALTYLVDNMPFTNELKIDKINEVEQDAILFAKRVLDEKLYLKEKQSV